MYPCGCRYEHPVAERFPFSARSCESLGVSLQSINDLTITTKRTEIHKSSDSQKCQIDLRGADNEGIVKVLSKYLAEKSINILKMETHTSHSPVSGTPLFNLNAFVSIPNDVEEKLIQSDLSQIAQDLGVEIQLGN